MGARWSGGAEAHDAWRRRRARAVFGGLGVGGQAGELGRQVARDVGGKVPLLGVSGGPILLGKGVGDPVLENQSVRLHLGGGRAGRGKRKGNREGGSEED